MRSLLLIALSLWAVPLSADEPKPISIKTISSIQRAIIPIVCTQINESGWEIKRIVGTGFFINRDGYFLTAAHVVLDWDNVNKNFGPCFPAFYFPKTSWAEQNRTAILQVQWFRFSECKFDR